MLQRLALKGGFFPLLKAYRQIERSSKRVWSGLRMENENGSRAALDKTIVLEVYVTGLK